MLATIDLIGINAYCDDLMRWFSKCALGTPGGPFQGIFKVTISIIIFFFFYKFIHFIYFIFGYVGSPLLRAGSL